MFRVNKTTFFESNVDFEESWPPNEQTEEDIKKQNERRWQGSSKAVAKHPGQDAKIKSASFSLKMTDKLTDVSYSERDKQISLSQYLYSSKTSRAEYACKITPTRMKIEYPVHMYGSSSEISFILNFGLHDEKSCDYECDHKGYVLPKIQQDEIWIFKADSYKKTSKFCSVTAECKGDISQLFIAGNTLAKRVDEIMTKAKSTPTATPRDVFKQFSADDQKLLSSIVVLFESLDFGNSQNGHCLYKIVSTMDNAVKRKEGSTMIDEGREQLAKNLQSGDDERAKIRQRQKEARKWEQDQIKKKF